MTKKILHIIRLALGAAALSLSLHAMSEQPSNDPTIDTIEDLKSKLSEIRKSHGAVAMAVAVIENGELVLMDSQGMANKEQGITATEDTLFRIGSISKMFVGLAILKLAEEGKLDLNATLNSLAPEIVHTNKWESTHPLRLSHLLEHTTGWDDMKLNQYANNNPSPIPLSDAMMLHPDSRISRWPPGTRMSYSNTGPAVAAYVVEKISGMVFEEYVQNNFFSPLEMPSSTFYKPEPTDAAATYIGHDAQDFWHLIYRPSGSISSSLSEMSNFLDMLIHRGRYNNIQIVNTSSIDRMEISKTTPGYKAGIKSGYGLANYTSGLTGKHIEYHGHGGGLPGGYANLGYNSEFKNGFILLQTGSPEALIPATLAIKQYLTRNTDSAAPNTSDIPPTFNEYLGLYKPINPRNESFKIAVDFLGLVKLTGENNLLTVAPILGSPLPPTTYYPNKDNVFISSDTGLPEMSFVEDPLSGRVLQVGTQFLVPISKVEAWFKIGGMSIFSLLLICSIVYGFFWVPLNIYRKTMTSPNALIRLWPLLSGVCLIALVTTIQMGSRNIVMLGTINLTSIIIFTLSLLYPALCLWSAKILFSKRANPTNRIVYWFSVILVSTHLFFAAYLAAYGMIGFRTWA